MSSSSRGRRRAVVIGTTVGVIVCLAGAGVAYAATRPSTGAYRTASVTTGDVTETVPLSGTVSSTSRSSAAFQVAGTVSSVNVGVGQTVSVGQTLATLDTTSLNSALADAQQNATTANQTLASDLASQTAVATTASTSSSSSSARSASTTQASNSSSSTGHSSTAESASVTSAVAAVTGAQQQLAAQFQAAQADEAKTAATVAAASPTCQAFLQANGGGSGTGTGTGTGAGTGGTGTGTGASTTTGGSGGAGTGTSTGGTATGGTGSGTGTGGTGTTPGSGSGQSTGTQSALSQCQAAISSALSSEQATANAQKAEQAGVSALNAAVAGLQHAVQAESAGEGSTSGTGAGTGTGTGASTSASGSSSTTNASTSNSGGSYSGTGTGSSSEAAASVTPVASAQTVLADQADVAAANSAVEVAQRDVGLATLTSPIAGTVAAVSITAGSDVSAGSTSDVISVIAPGGWSVDTDVDLTHVGSLKVGQSVTTSVAGYAGTLAGKVSSIGFTDTSTDSTTPDYAVTVALSDPDAKLLNGASATMQVAISSISKTLTVPSSAVHTRTRGSYVLVLHNGVPVITAVKVGIADANRTQILSGVTKGSAVILADLNEAVPSSSTGSTTTGGFRTGLGGGFGGGRFGGGLGGAGGLRGTGGGLGGR